MPSVLLVVLIVHLALGAAAFDTDRDALSLGIGSLAISVVSVSS